jgi:hypothetical protein
VKYTDDLVPPANSEKTMLEGMSDRIIEIGRCYGTEMNLEKSKILRTSREPSPVQTTTDHKQLENVPYFSGLGRMI